LVTAVLLVLALGSAAAGAALPGAAGVAGVLVAAVLVGVAARCAGPVVALFVLLLVSILQNLAVTPLASSADRGAVLALLVAKEILALSIGACGLWILRGRLRPLDADAAAVVYAALVVLVAAGDGAGSFAAFATLRQALTLPFLWLVGRSLALDSREAKRAVGVVLRIGLIVAVFGLVERFVLGDRFWADLGLSSLYEKKGLGAFLRGALPANFFSWDWGRPLRRLVGPMGEPTTTAHLLALPAALVVGARTARGSRGPGAVAVSLVLVLALGLTLGKSGIATFLVGVGAAFWHRGRLFRKAAVATLGLAGAAFALATTTNANLQKNLALHAAGLLHLGHLGASGVGGGFGTAGNFTAAIAHDSTVGVATESFIASLAVQAGLASVVAFLVFCVAAAHDLWVPVNGGAARDVRAVLAGLVLATGLTALASETPVAFLAGGLIFLVAGALAAPPEPPAP
jgi:hypothetical protein